MPLITYPDELLQSVTYNLSGTLDFDFQIDIIIIGDYAMFEKFMEIYNNNTENAYFGLRSYLQSIFDQATNLIFQEKLCLKNYLF